MPTIADTFSHLLNYSEHIATVHHDHGKSHVHYEYIKVAKESSREDKPHPNTQKKASNSVEHILLINTCDPAAYPLQPVHLNSIFSHLPFVLLQEDFRPPILALG